MTTEGERRRARLGEAAVAAARREAREAPAPSPALFDAVAVLLGSLRRSPSTPPTGTTVAERDDVA